MTVNSQNGGQPGARPCMRFGDQQIAGRRHPCRRAIYQLVTPMITRIDFFDHPWPGSDFGEVGTKRLVDPGKELFPPGPPLRGSSGRKPERRLPGIQQSDQFTGCREVHTQAFHLRHSSLIVTSRVFFHTINTAFPLLVVRIVFPAQRTVTGNRLVAPNTIRTWPA